MGDRAYIQITSEQFQTPIAFYGHWSGEQNVQAVRSVLNRTGRIGDAGYLAAQIFHEFTTLGNYDGELSFGIYPEEIPLDHEENPTVYVNADTGTYQVENERPVTIQELRANYYELRTSQYA